MALLRLAILFFLAYSQVTFAAVDKELMQSIKCVNVFRYYETKLKIPTDTLYSISLQETGKIHSDKKIKIAYPWTVNVEGKGFYFDTKREAVEFVKQQQRAGKESIDVGCMQVNLKHHPEAFKSIEHAFHPRANIEYAAKFLRSKYEQLGSWGKAVAHYHSATSHLGEKYKNSVVNIAQNIDHYKSAFKRNKTQKNTTTAVAKQPRLASANIIPRSNGRPIHPNIKERRYRSNMMIYVPQKRAS